MKISQTGPCKYKKLYEILLLLKFKISSYITMHNSLLKLRCTNKDRASVTIMPGVT